MQEIDNNQNEIILFPPSSLFINVGLKEITSAYANFLLFEIHQHRRMKSYQAISLRSKHFQSSYCAKVRAEAKKSLKGEGEGRRGNLHSPPPPPSFIFFLLLSQFSRWTSRGNACYASYQAIPLLVICTSKSKELMTTIKKTSCSAGKVASVLRYLSKMLCQGQRPLLPNICRWYFLNVILVQYTLKLCLSEEKDLEDFSSLGFLRIPGFPTVLVLGN